MKIHSHLFFTRPTLYRNGSPDVPGGAESLTETGFYVQALVEEWMVDGVDLAQVEKSIEDGKLSVGDLGKVIRELERREAALDQRMLELTDELKEYVFFHGSEAEERERNEAASEEGEFKALIRAGKYELALLKLYKVADKGKMLPELLLVAEKKPELLILHLNDLKEDGALLITLLTKLQEGQSMDTLLSMAFDSIYAKAPYLPEEWFEQLGTSLAILGEHTDLAWYDREKLGQQVSEALTQCLRRDFVDAKQLQEFLAFVRNEESISLDINALQPELQQFVKRGLLDGMSTFVSIGQEGNAVLLMEELKLHGVKILTPELNAAAVRYLNAELRSDFDSFPAQCKSFLRLGFQLNEELVRLANDAAERERFMQKKRKELQVAMDKKDYEKVAYSLYLLKDDFPRLKLTVETLLAEAPEYLLTALAYIARVADANTDGAWFRDILSQISRKIDVGVALGEAMRKGEKVYIYDIASNLRLWYLFKETGITITHKPVQDAFEERLLADYASHDDEMIPLEVQTLIKIASVYDFPYDKDKLSYYANARLLQSLDGLDQEVTHLRYALQYLYLDIEEMKRAGLTVDRGNLDELVNAYIKKYQSQYSDDPSSALYLDDLVKAAQRAGVTLDKEIFSL